MLEDLKTHVLFGAPDGMGGLDGGAVREGIVLDAIRTNFFPICPFES